MVAGAVQATHTQSFASQLSISCGGGGGGSDPPPVQVIGPNFFSGPSANQKFSLVPSAQVSLGQKISSAPPPRPPPPGHPPPGQTLAAMPAAGRLFWFLQRDNLRMHRQGKNVRDLQNPPLRHCAQIAHRHPLVTPLIPQRCMALGDWSPPAALGGASCCPLSLPRQALPLCWDHLPEGDTRMVVSSAITSSAEVQAGGVPFQPRSASDFDVGGCSIVRLKFARAERRVLLTGAGGWG